MYLYLRMMKLKIQIMHQDNQLFPKVYIKTQILKLAERLDLQVCHNISRPPQLAILLKRILF